MCKPCEKCGCDGTVESAKTKAALAQLTTANETITTLQHNNGLMSAALRENVGTIAELEIRVKGRLHRCLSCDSELTEVGDENKPGDSILQCEPCLLREEVAELMKDKERDTIEVFRVDDEAPLIYAVHANLDITSIKDLADQLVDQEDTKYADGSYVYAVKYEGAELNELFVVETPGYWEFELISFDALHAPHANTPCGYDCYELGELGLVPEDGCPVHDKEVES